MPPRPKPSSAVHLASDIGGTFTDFVWLDHNGQLHTSKHPTSQEHPASVVTDMLEHVCPRIHSHGTTIATNAVLERTGAQVAFVTTEGFQDLLHIGRQDRPDLYDPEKTRTPSLASRKHVFTVSERIGPDGNVIQPLTDTEVDELEKELNELQPDSVAICLLHAYANPEHEQRIADSLRQSNSISVSCSSEVLPEFREYERASSTVMNAYIAPVVQSYINQLEHEKDHSLFLMKSTEGVAPRKQVLERPLDLLLSGPAGGAVAGARLGVRKEEQQIITLDMGGTSADISLVVDGEPVWTSSSHVDGLPVGRPMIDIETVGAGGGSIARFDEGGALQVGPESAGSHPGPVCYDQGGTDLTVTDAHFVLGHIGTNTTLAEHLSLAPERTLKAFEEKCSETSMSIPKLASGILDVVNSRMSRAIRSSLMKHGYEPSQFALVVFGGAGPLHACKLAERLNISKILIPEHPGVFSATGVLQADQTSHQMQTVLEKFSGLSEDLVSILNELEDRARNKLQQTPPAFSGKARARSSLDLRYRGQSYEINLPRSVATVEQFHNRHEELYGYRVPDEQIEVVNARARACLSGSTIDDTPPSNSSSPPESMQSRSPLYHDPFTSFDVYNRDTLNPGHSIEQPAIIEEMSSTTRVADGWRAHVEPDGVLELSSP